jgi:type I restriction enzyme R subunit
MIEFKQIIGRGTRLFEGKSYFTVYDFVEAPHHFYDPEWDGEPEEPETPEPRPQPQPCDVCGHRPCICAQEPPPEPCHVCGYSYCRCDTPPRRMVKVKLADGKVRQFQHMISTLFYSPDGRPISAEEFLNNLFGELPNLFKSEDELRTLWSNPLTRRTLLEKLDAAGFGKDELTTLQKLIDAEKSDLFDVLEYVFNSDIKPMTREARVAAAQATIFALLDNKQKEFIEFVLSKYIETGVEELDQEKLPILLTNKYQSLEDAKDILGDVANISRLFIEFQQHLYKQKVA